MPDYNQRKKIRNRHFLPAGIMGAFERNDLLFRNSVGVSDRLSVDYSKGRMGSELRRELEGARNTVEQVS